ncbi:hypothetical protein KKF34_16110 [Myxococcota bacterium]|nr:hypothetical protein [Myxococcota bacterium]MBU1382722.1 hypothetical protein [Myxococcota bacterium]MBU1498401.1 hypothetical protein [Myxococcota bacterium]
MKNLFLIALLLFVACDDSTTVDTCGDGILDPEEQCDSGNINGARCIDEGFYSGTPTCSSDCTVDYSTCDQSISCGDGLIQVVHMEQCDGNNLNNETCEDHGYYGGTLSCDNRCKFDFTNCAAIGRCGDDEIQGTEDCDGTNFDGQSCTSLGYYGGDLSCTDECTFDLASCASAGSCGDGDIQTEHNEECDGTNLGTTCELMGYHGGNLSCRNDCTYDLSSCESYGMCGDGIYNTDFEGCDGTDLGDQTCLSVANKAYGEPLCNTACVLLTSQDYCYGKRYQMVGATGFSGCGVDTEDNLFCWGYNDVGQLGNGDNISSTIPVHGDTSVVFTKLTNGGNKFTCALSTGGAIYCWGNNSDGQLGVDDAANRSSPTVVADSTLYKEVSAGHSHACGITINNVAKCWGSNTQFQIYSTFPSTDRLTPSVSGTDYRKIAAGGYHTCAVRSDTGVVHCWGAGSEGQLGDGQSISNSDHVTASGLTEVSEIYAGLSISCAIDSGNYAWCWGSNQYGQIGNGGSSNTYNSPVQVTGNHQFVKLSLHSTHVCGIDTAGGLWCWGNNGADQLGLGTVAPSHNEPQQVSPGTIFTDVAVGPFHTCAVEESGGIWCWGSDSTGQLGNGTDGDSAIPDLITDI